MKEQLSKFAAFLSIVLAMSGGLYFGAFSCGGASWHKPFFLILFAVSLGTVLALPPRALRRAEERILFAGLVLILFIIMRGGTAAFYPAAPSTWAGFVTSFVKGIIYGPC